MSSIIKNKNDELLGWNWGCWVFAPSVFSLCLVVVGVVAFVGLGFWQLERAAFKDGLIKQKAISVDSKFLDNAELALLIGGQQDARYLKVDLRGEHKNDLIILQNKMYNAVQGYFVYTPLFLTGEQSAVLVNWGWRELEQNREFIDHIFWNRDQHIKGTLDRTVSGIAVAEEQYVSSPYLLATLNYDELSKALGYTVYPYEVRVSQDSADGFVRDWAMSAQGTMPPEKHRAYAFQWFALALTALILFFKLNIKRALS